MHIITVCFVSRRLYCITRSLKALVQSNEILDILLFEYVCWDQ